MRFSHILTTLVLALPSLLAAQSNSAGTWHFNVGASLGLHAAHYEGSYTIPDPSISVATDH